uniref:Xin actin binding repeat containing 2b n=1 Tax=Amphiprion ocellaris TaxID=80972 RepID=A0A3Q1BH60_AMPOC
MEESEVCSLPGGLASVRKQFETQETATSHNVTQFHFHHRAVQVYRTEKYSYSGHPVQAVTDVMIHILPLLFSYKVEKHLYFWTVLSVFIIIMTLKTSVLVDSKSNDNIPACDYSHEPPEPANQPKGPLSKEAYFKQRNMSELKRLYKHIHPEVRKNIEKECFIDYRETDNNHVESQEYMYEDDGGVADDINDEEYGEWEEILPGEVQAMRWRFENKPLDAIKDETPDEDEDNKAITQQEIILGKDVRRTAWMFETKPMDELGSQNINSMEYKNKFNKFDKGDVRAAAWLFETQTMDTLNKMHMEEDLTKEVSFTEEDGNATIYMIDNKFMASLGHTETIDESHLLSLRSVLEEINEDVKTVTSTFDTQFKCIIMGQSSQMLEIKSVRKIETELENSIASRWLFDTQPLDMASSEPTSLKLVCSLSMEDSNKGDWGRWLFEIKTLNSLSDWESSQMEKKEIVGADVRKHCLVFETQPMDSLKDDSNARPGYIEEIIGGNVRSARHFFESSPQAARKNCPEVGKLKKTAVNEEMKGDVRHQKWRFESQPLEHIREEKKEVTRTVNVEDDLTQEDGTSCRADVRKNCWVFETQPMDTLKDDSNTHPLTKEEVIAGNVKSARHYFETFPTEELKELPEVGKLKKTVALNEEKGDVRHQKWRFESQPLDIDKYQIIKATVETITNGDVKTCTWLFETQALDTIHDETETVLTTCTTKQEDIRGKDVRMACFLFETEKLENLTGEETGSFKRVTEIDIASGDVSRMKYIFENQTSDIMTSTSEELMQNLKRVQTEDIQRGNVVSCKWLFENQSIDTIHDSQEESMSSRTVNDVQGGDVDKGRFIFETFSLDKIQEASSDTDTELMKMQKIVCDEVEKGDVRNYTMMFETQPLYAVQDKEGHYHEVTTVTSEEVTQGNVVGTRWLFETKPLDAIKDTDEVYIIKSVTQQDVQKGDVMSAKWKFETQPLDRIAEENKTLIKTVDDIQGGNVRMNKNWFESDAASLGSVKTVNVSEIQKGDVRTAKWRFETQSIDKIRSMSSENLIETVKKEEVTKGDVKNSVWLFEKNPLDHIKETDEDEDTTVTQEEIPKADVKTTTWLFETTPFDDFNETKMERTEILGKSIKGTLEELYCQKMVKSKGILIEADEIGDVRMAKYQLMNQEAPEIQREEVIRGDLQTIMMNLLNRQERKEQQIVIDSEEKGNISSTVQQLFSQDRASSIEREEILRGDIQEAINKLFNEDGSAKHGILIQEDEKGDVQMTIYSLMNQQDNVNVEKEDIVKGNIKSALQRLSSLDKSDQAVKIKIDDTEKGNVNFYSTCIESGALDYLKQLHLGPDETPPDRAEKEKIVGGDIKGTKLILGRNQTQIERTVEDVIPGDVHNTVKVFMAEPTVSLERLQREEIVKGDLRAALNSLSESVNQTVVVEKEEVVKGNIPKALRCLERAQRQYKEVEKPDIIPGNIRGALRSLEKSATSRVEAAVDDLVPGDVKATLKSLELAKKAVKDVEKEEIVRGDIHTALQSLQDASSEIKKCQQEIDVQGDVRGTIQMLMEHPPSPRMQRSSSLEGDVKGDVKMSIKSLYEMQEQNQLEKEEVIKGDVKGTIKSLLETAQRETPKVRLGAYRRVRVKQSPPVKNLNADAERNIQKIKTAKQSETSIENHSTSNETEIVRTKSCTVEQSAQQSTTMVEHKTITQNHGIKSVKTEFRNLKSNPKGMIKVGKTRVKTDVYVLKPQTPEPDLPLPPPPAIDTDLPPPPPSPPASVDTDIDHLPPPPPPPPLTSEQDFLPPPPSQQELESMPAQAAHLSPGKAKKMTVKKVKAPVLHPVPKLEPKVEFSQKQQVEVSQTQLNTTTHPSKTEILPPPPSPQPLKKVYIAPVKFTPPPSPPPFMKAKMSKFNTPLMKAEEKYRKLKEENTPPTTPTPTFIHDSVTAALEMLSTQDAEITQERAEKTAVSVYSDALSCDLSKQVGVSNTTQSKASTHQEKILTDSTIVSSANQKIVSNETSKVISIQKASSVSAVRQQMHSTTQKSISVSSKQSVQSVMTDKVQTSITDVTKTDTITADTKKNQKTKGFNKSEDKKEDKIPAEKIRPDTELMQLSNNLCDLSSQKEHATAERHVKENKSSHSEKKTDHSPTKSQENVSNQPMQTDKAAASTNGKASKSNQKVKKNNKQEKQAEIKASSESEKPSGSQDSKVEVKEAAVVKVINEAKEVKTELKQGIKKAAPSSPAVTESNADSQPETPAPTKKKKKSKKSKNGAQSAPNKDILTESIETKIAISEKRRQTHETIAVTQIHTSMKEEHIQVKSEVITTESKDDANSQQQKAVQKHAKDSQKKGVTVTQQSAKKAPEESKDVPITVTGESKQNELAKSTTGRAEESQRQEVQVLISDITEIQRASDSKSVRSLFSKVPEWLMTTERKCELQKSLSESDTQKNREILLHLRKLAEAKLMHLEDGTMEKHEVSEKAVSGATRISKISIGSAKIENQTKKMSGNERRREEVGQCKSIDLRAPSPLLRMRSPSPTFITIESTRRTDSPQRVTPSPTLLHRPPTPPTPPPRRCDTPTSRLTRITPSPTFDRAENLARLKDTTAKLSRGVTPPPLLPNQILEKKSEISETQMSSGPNDPDLGEDSDASERLSASVKEKREFFEEARKAEINKIYVRKEPIAIPERLGPDMEECEQENKNKEKDEVPRADMSSLVNKFESPEEKLYIRKELIPLTERLHNDTESTDCDKEKANILEEEMPTFDIQAIKNVFELGEQSSLFREEKKDQEELVSSKPSAFSETKSITEHFSDVDEFGNKVTGTMTAITEHSQSVSTHPAPFSYADAVKRKAAAVRRTETYDEDATENLLRNFHKTWTESETVFKSLGYTVSEESTSQMVSRQTKIVLVITKGTSGSEMLYLS